VARHAAQAGGAVIRSGGREIASVETKGRGDYVTAVDHESQRVIVSVLRAAFPDLPVLAEEGAGAELSDGWVVDPLDGTTNHILGFPVVSVSVALMEQGQPVVGVVDAPLLGWRFEAARGAGAHDAEGRRLRVSRRPVEQAVVATGFPFRAPERRPRYLRMLDAVLAEVEDGRRAGSAALDLALTAAGVFDGFFELGLRVWDIAAGALLVAEAGGVVSEWEGEGAPWGSGDILAGSPAVHAALRRGAAATATA